MSIFDDIFPDLASDLMELFSGDTLSIITEENGDFDFREDETLSNPTTYSVRASPPIEYTAYELNSENNIARGDARIFIAAQDLEDQGLDVAPNPDTHSITDGLGKKWKIIKVTDYASGDLHALYELQVRS